VNCGSAKIREKPGREKIVKTLNMSKALKLKITRNRHYSMRQKKRSPIKEKSTDFSSVLFRPLAATFNLI
jgi:hypothetical protein